MSAKATTKAAPTDHTESPEAKEREKAISLAVSQLERRYGKGTIMNLADENILPVAVIPTGALSLDLALGVGGVPRGRVVEVYGPEGGGKTTLCLHIIAEAQKKGGVAAFIDAEHAFDRFWAKRLGVNVETLLFAQPDDAEQALEIVETLVRSNAVDCVVIDSVAGLAPRAELAGEMGDAHVGLVARLMSQALRKLTGVISKSRTCVIFINQVREKIGVVYGNPEVTPGGRALKFAASVRMEVRRGEAIKQGSETVGYRTRVKVLKNKVAPPYTQAEFDLEFSGGIPKEGSIIDVAADFGIIQKAGAWFSYGDERLGQGRENAKAYLRENPVVAAEIETKVRDVVTTELLNRKMDESQTRALTDDDSTDDFDDLAEVVEDLDDES
ncbi:MAG: recombinase RecA [Candidatus Poribacteria bacterium]|nr:recombinase RecA [Candidatus Poribacteria bacterium]